MSDTDFREKDELEVRTWLRRPRAWIIRLGQDGGLEEYSLENDIAAISFRELAPPHPEVNQDELREMIGEAFLDKSQGARNNFLGQIWTFISKIKAGDIVVCPLKTKSGYVMIGRCTSSYHPAPPETRDDDNMRIGVDWNLPEVSMASLGSGISHYLKTAIRTVSWLDDNVSERLENFVNGGDTRKYWWVNQNNSWESEYSLGIVTAPTSGKKGQKISHHLNVGRIFKGDVVLHYRKGSIVAVSEALTGSSIEQRPYTGGDDRWNKEVFLAHCWYETLDEIIPRDEISLRFEGKEPFTANGTVRQGYLFELESEFIEQFIQDHGHRLTGTALNSLSKTFIFQGKPEIGNFNFDDWLKAAEPGTQYDWTVTQLEDKMSAGDRVLFWKSGSEAGIYAVGKLTGEFHNRESNESLASESNELAAYFTFRECLEQPLLKSELKQHPVLKDLSIIKMASGTNWLISDSDWLAIRDLIVGVDNMKGTPGDTEIDKGNSSLSALGKRLYFDPPHFFAEVKELLDDRPQAIFYGPPGTGKTFAALELAEILAGHASRTKLVQFHPSYAYEDFIEGWRPTKNGSFKITDGPLKRMADDAADNPDETFVLVIDEINRANLSKVLGELFFLLEYRDRSITLQYSDTNFKLPENLKIIGTMNTADRSISLIDAALRRRFYFHEFFPDREPIQGLLRRWLDAQGKTDLLWVADLVDAANSKLDERNLSIGPSHFLKADLDEEKVQKIWKRSIMPYIVEHYFDDPDQATEFTYDQLRNNA